MDPSTALQVFVSPLLGVVFEILGSLIQKEIGLVLGVSKELEKLSNILSTIQDVLEDAEVKQIDDKPINNWLRKLKDLVYEAHDILDECATEFYGDHLQDSSSLFPSLRKLEICNMPNLEEWCAPSSSSTQEENIRVVFSSLECLKLERCPKLRTLPTTLSSSSLTELVLSDCNEMVLESSSSLVKVVITSGCLQKLEINYFKKIKTLPKVFMENLPSTLTELEIRGCDELVCLPEGVMQNLTSLNSFQIWNCPSLKVLPELGSKNNTALRTLEIEYCHGLTSMSDCLRHLTALEDLSISHSPEMKFYLTIFRTSLPLQQVAGTLESLRICGCEGMTSLPDWMDKFTSLRDLRISNCENLKVLPEEVLHLTSLQDLSIVDCHPDLHRRCAKETGEDWHKIAHIPHLYIGEESTTLPKKFMKCNMIPCFSSSSSSSSTN